MLYSTVGGELLAQCGMGLRRFNVRLTGNPEDSDMPTLIVVAIAPALAAIIYDCCCTKQVYFAHDSIIELYTRLNSKMRIFSHSG